MEKLTEVQRVSVSKMSDARLRNKLLQAGYREEMIAQLGRAELLSTFAEILAAESGQAMAKVDRGDEVLEDVEEEDRDQLSLEERRLRLEEMRLDEQRLQRELEQKRWNQKRNVGEKNWSLRRKLQSGSRLIEIVWQ